MDMSPYPVSSQGVEVPLQGGNLSQVVRVGDTVRRGAGPWTPAVHALLQYLERAEFDGAPRARGVDSRGREVVTYVEGDVFQYPMPDFVWNAETLVSVARLLRRYHDTIRGFVPPPDAAWQIMVGAPRSGPVICHNDIAPYNMVFRGHVPVAFIDWDTAAPGPALYDVAHAAWRWIPLQDASWAPIDDQFSRLRLFCDAYGLTKVERGQLIPLVRTRQEVVLATIRVWGEAGKPGWAHLLRMGHDKDIRDCLRWVDENLPALEAALTE